MQADAVYRYHKLMGYKTFLTTGADENSLKNVQAAEAKGITTQELCSVNAAVFRDLATKIGLSFDSFLRSSIKKDHWPGVHRLWKLCNERGDVYKKKYSGLYCVDCETFYTENELENGLCPEHRTKPQYVEEENYFFRLSKYQKELEKLISSGKLKILPERRKNEVLSFIRSGLEDFSISRSKERAKGWGVPVPEDETQIIFVWFDALGIYLTGIGYGTEDSKFRKWWPADVHVIGKGIIRFHAVYWPAMLLSAGLPLPKSIFVHGYITVEGQKMSKSLGNVINPLYLIQKYNSDVLRYFFLRLSPFEDGDFSEKIMVERANEELVSNYSNLFYRITSFIEKNFDGKVPKEEKHEKEEKTVLQVYEKRKKEYHDFMNQLRLNDALLAAMDISSELNRYFQEKKPWQDPKNSEGTLHFAVNILEDLTILLYSFIPHATEKALKCLGSKDDLRSIGKMNLKKGQKIKSAMLFKKIEYKENKQEKKAIKKEQEHKPVLDIAEEIKVINDMLPFNEFKKVDMRVGTITEVEDHPDADKLYVLQVDLGTEKRQLVAALKGIYSKEEMKNRQVIVVCNLEPKKMRGVESHGMLLAAEDGTLLSPEKNVRNGSKVM